MVVKVKERKYDVSVRYRDGGMDKYYGLKEVCVDGDVLKIVENNYSIIYIVLSIVSYIKVEEVRSEEDTRSVQKKS